MKSYYTQMTWLRGFCAFLVICSHTIKATEVNYNANEEVSSALIHSPFNLGTLGVLIFFSLSGFTLYVSNGHILQKRKGILAFYVKRFTRIWPAFFVSLGVYLVANNLFKAFYLEKVGVNGYWIEQHIADYSVLDVLRYVLLLFDIPETRNTLFNGAYWSLPIEFHYYFIFPILLFFIASSRVYLLPIIGLVFVLMGGWLNYSFNINSHLLLLAYTFIGGVGTAWFHSRNGTSISNKVAVLCISFLFIGAALLEGRYIPAFIVPVKFYLLVFGVIAILIVFFASFINVSESNNIVSKILSNYGTVSYSTYLFHSLFIMISVYTILIHDINGIAAKVTTFLITFIGSFIVANISYILIEKPGINMGRYFSQWLSNTGQSNYTGLSVLPENNLKTRKDKRNNKL